MSKAMTQQLAQTKLVKNTVMFLEVFGLVGLILLGLYLFQVSQDESYFPVKNVSIDDELYYADKAQVLVAIRSSLRGSFFSVALEDVEKISVQNPWIESVRLRRIWPDHIRVYVTERLPVFRYGETALLSRHGDVFTPFAMPESVMYLPMIRANESEAKRMLSLLGDIQTTLQDTSLEIAEVELEAENVTFLMSNGLTVRAQMHDAREKFIQLARVYQPVLAGKTNKIKTLDLRYDHGFAVAWQ